MLTFIYVVKKSHGVMDWSVCMQILSVVYTPIVGYYILYTVYVLDITVLHFDQFVPHMNIDMWKRTAHRYHFLRSHFQYCMFLV
jgi:hypothetical protein